MAAQRCWQHNPELTTLGRGPLGGSLGSRPTSTAQGREPARSVARSSGSLPRGVHAVQRAAEPIDSRRDPPCMMQVSE